MADSWIDIQGLDEAVKRINKIADRIRPEDLEKVLMQGAKIVQADVKRRIGSLFKVKTGNLSKSPRAKKSRLRGVTFAAVFAAIDRKKAPHAHLHEFGTSKMQARPVFRPAVDGSRAEVAAVVNAGIAKLLEEAAK